MASHVGICGTLCTVQGNVKYSSIESGQTCWKTGNLALATTVTGQVVCLVNFKIGPAKTFTLTNQIKGVIFNYQVPRCVINLTTGTNINWTGKCDKKPINSRIEVNRFSQILEELKNRRKQDGRPNSSAQLGLHMSPQGQACTPVKQSTGVRNSQSNQSQNGTPRLRLSVTTPPAPVAFMPQKNNTPKGTSGRTSPNPMMTPSHLKAAMIQSTPEPINVFDIKDESGTGSDEGPTELSPVLFTDVQSEGEKENGEGKNYRIPKVNGNIRSKSAYVMRKEEGRSLFMSSFQEKQLQLEERKENTAPRPSSGAKGFYSRGRQAAGYTATDALFQPRQTNSNMSYKRTPGFLNLSQPKRPCLSTNYTGWSQKNIPSSIKTSQVCLQGFSNLGNTCYMNAILQSLFALDRFAMDILNGDLPHMQKDSLYKALASLLFAKQRNLSADRIGMQLRRVKQAISSTAARFSGFMQHDAQEFLCQCLDQLKEDWEKAQQRGLDAPPSDNARTEGKEDDPKTSLPCPVIGNFEFEVMHSIVCKQCGEVVTKAEQFYDLSLDMPRRSASNPTGSIQMALEQFFREEAIEYACSECDCKQATVTHTFTRLPRVIIVHLKRYRFDIDAVQNAKLQRRILIPQYLTLHYHCTKETRSPTSLPKSLINGASSPQRLLNGERTSITDSPDGNASPTSQSQKPSLFTFSSSTSRKRLEYNSSNKSIQPRQASLLDEPLRPNRDETKLALEMSKKEAERAKQEQEMRRRQEEEELKKAMEQSKQDADRSISVMSEEQQLAYVLAISKQDSSMLHPPNQSASKGDNPEVLQEFYTDVDVQNLVEDDEDKEVFVSLKRRDRNDNNLSVDEIHLRGAGDSADNTTPWKRFKSGGQVSNQSTPSEHAQCAGDSGTDVVDDAHNRENSRTPSRLCRGVRKSIMNLFTPIKQTPRNSALGLDNTHVDTPRLTQKPILVEASSVDIHRELDHNTLQGGEDGVEKPSYEELKAKEDEELRRATELSLQDAKEMAKKEEDAMKRAKEISLQEFSESFNSLEDSEDSAEPMEIDDEEEDDDTTKELTKNAESGHLPFSYRLISVVSHIGSTSSVGHYISDVYDSKKSTWLSYDDSQVVRMSESAVREERERTGYIFFYVAK